MRNPKFFAGFAVVMAVALAVAFIYVMRNKQPEQVPSRPPASAGKPPSFRKGAVRLQAPPERQRTAEEKYIATRKVAIIIDDIGYDLAPVDELLAIDAPIAFSILPHCVHSVDSALALHRAGREVLLHLPMEPYAYPRQNPGAGALSWA